MLLCIFAHPDDEAFGPGGAVAKFASETETGIICVTKGNAGKNDELGIIRQEELRASAAILGVSTVYFLDFDDGSLCNNNYLEVADKVKNVMEEIEPDALMTFDLNGVSGHIDHVVVSMATSFLFERLPYPKKLLYFCEKRIITDKMAQKYFIFFPPGYKESQVDLALDVSQFYDKKILAMEAHKSQQSDKEMILSLQGEHLKTEYFRIWEK